MQISKILTKFDELINEAGTLENEAKSAHDGRVSSSGYLRLLSSARTLFVYLDSKVYLELVDKVGVSRETINSNTYRAEPGMLKGILESAKREFSFGLISHPRILATADSMEDLLEQAEYLLEQDYKDASCVLTGGVLEGTLRSMLENKYSSLKFDPKKGLRHLNEVLHQASAYDKATFKLIDGYAELRNNSAHGKYELYSKSQVNEFIGFVRNFISNWFAVKVSVSDI